MYACLNQGAFKLSLNQDLIPKNLTLYKYIMKEGSSRLTQPNISLSPLGKKYQVILI